MRGVRLLLGLCIFLPAIVLAGGAGKSDRSFPRFTSDPSDCPAGEFARGANEFGDLDCDPGGAPEIGMIGGGCISNFGRSHTVGLFGQCSTTATIVEGRDEVCNTIISYDGVVSDIRAHIGQAAGSTHSTLVEPWFGDPIAACGDGSCAGGETCTITSTGHECTIAGSFNVTAGDFFCVTLRRLPSPTSGAGFQGSGWLAILTED